MQNIGRSISGIGGERRTDGYIGPIASTGDGGKSANVNNLNNSQLRGLMHVAPYGISSRPMVGMKGQVIVNDNSNNTLIGVHDQNRPDVGSGEILLYSVGGCQIYLDRDGNITMRTGGALINVQPDGNMNVTGNVSISGNININGSLSINGIPIEQLFQ